MSDPKNQTTILGSASLSYTADVLGYNNVDGVDGERNVPNMTAHGASIGVGINLATGTGVEDSGLNLVTVGATVDYQRRFANGDDEFQIHAGTQAENLFGVSLFARELYFPWGKGFGFGARVGLSLREGPAADTNVEENIAKAGGVPINPDAPEGVPADPDFAPSGSTAVVGPDGKPTGEINFDNTDNIYANGYPNLVERSGMYLDFLVAPELAWLFTNLDKDLHLLISAYLGLSVSKTGFKAGNSSAEKGITKRGMAFGNEGSLLFGTLPLCKETEVTLDPAIAKDVENWNKWLKETLTPENRRLLNIPATAEFEAKLMERVPSYNADATAIAGVEASRIVITQTLHGKTTILYTNRAELRKDPDILKNFPDIKGFRPMTKRGIERALATNKAEEARLAAALQIYNLDTAAVKFSETKMDFVSGKPTQKQMNNVYMLIGRGESNIDTIFTGILTDTSIVALKTATTELKTFLANAGTTIKLNFEGSASMTGANTPANNRKNQILSEFRAQAIRQFLVASGINKDQLNEGTGIGRTDKYGPVLADNQRVKVSREGVIKDPVLPVMDDAKLIHWKDLAAYVTTKENPPTEDKPETRTIEVTRETTDITKKPADSTKTPPQPEDYSYGTGFLNPATLIYEADSKLWPKDECKTEEPVAKTKEVKEPDTSGDTSGTTAPDDKATPPTVADKPPFADPSTYDEWNKTVEWCRAKTKEQSQYGLKIDKIISDYVILSTEIDAALKPAADDPKVVLTLKQIDGFKTRTYVLGIKVDAEVTQWRDNLDESKATSWQNKFVGLRAKLGNTSSNDDIEKLEGGDKEGSENKTNFIQSISAQIDQLNLVYKELTSKKIDGSAIEKLTAYERDTFYLIGEEPGKTYERDSQLNSERDYVVAVGYTGPLKIDDIAIDGGPATVNIIGRSAIVFKLPRRARESVYNYTIEHKPSGRKYTVKVNHKPAATGGRRTTAPSGGGAVE